MATQLVDPATTNEIVCTNPATGEETGRVPITTAAEVRKAVEAARVAQPAWAALSFRERARYVLRAREIVLTEANEIAHLISRETGKPAPEAMSMEVVPTLDLMYYFARNTARLLTPQRLDLGLYGLMGRSSTIVYKPVGVVGIISPWNFPWATPLDEVVMALMAGNAVVLKPSELTPLSSLKIAAIFSDAGLPNDLITVITGDGSTGAALVESETNKIMFTGSVATGKKVAESAARKLVPTVLELGGKDPMIVLEDANIANAAKAALWGAFCNAGQCCASIERCYVHESIASKFIDEVVRETKKLRTGQPAKEEVEIGSMTSEGQLQIVEDHISDAVDHGAQVLVGGKRRKGEGWFHEPTVVTNVDHSMKLMRDETFGPVLPITTFKTDEEAIKLANDSVFGLTASIWTNSMSRGRRMAQKIDAGTVMVNEVVYTHALAQTPWGGVKQSGYGRTHGRLGLLEMVIPQHVHVNRTPFVPDLWWFRYTPLAAELFRGLGRRFTTGSIFQASLLLPKLIRRLFENVR